MNENEFATGSVPVMVAAISIFHQSVCMKRQAMYGKGRNADGNNNTSGTI